MREFVGFTDAPLQDRAANCSLRERMLLGLVLFTLIQSGEALAGEQTAGADALDPDIRNLRILTTPGFFSVPNALDNQRFSATDFSPRKRTLFDPDPAANNFGDATMLRSTTVWQRLSDYKSRDGVRLLTLWESRSSTVALQAGKRGDPSLQWTSRLMNRGGSTQGLLDRWFSVSLAGASNRLRSLTRASANAAASSKQLDSPAAGLK